MTGQRPATVRKDCRLIVFYRFAPQQLQWVMPNGIRLCEIAGCGIGGIALVQRVLIASKLCPDRFATSETASHFVYVQPPAASPEQASAMLFRSDTSSRVRSFITNGLRMARRCHYAEFEVAAASESLRVCGKSRDGDMCLKLVGRPSPHLPRDSVFRSSEQVTRLLENDLRCLSLIPGARPRIEGSRAACQIRVVPLQILESESSLFTGSDFFFDGPATLDSAFWLRQDELVWGKKAAPCCDVAPV